MNLAHGAQGAQITRRTALGAVAALALARPGIIRAQTSSNPIKIGLLSDVGGPYRDVGGPGSKVAAELACEDVGGSLLGRPLQVLQADDQNKADVASAIAREWVDDKGVDVLADGAGSSAGLAIQEIARQRKKIYLMSTPTSTLFIGKQCSPYGFQFACNTYALAKGVGGELVRAGGNSWFSSPPTTSSATRSSATRPSSSSRPAARSWAACAPRSGRQIFPNTSSRPRHPGPR